MAKRRANGEGNIRKRKDGRWEGRYTAGYDEKTGKRLIQEWRQNAGSSEREAGNGGCGSRKRGCAASR